MDNFFPFLNKLLKNIIYVLWLVAVESLELNQNNNNSKVHNRNIKFNFLPFQKLSIQKLGYHNSYFI